MSFSASSVTLSHPSMDTNATIKAAMNDANTMNHVVATPKYAASPNRQTGQRIRDRRMTVRAVGTFLSNHVHFLSAYVMTDTINAMTPMKTIICDTSAVKFVMQTTPFLSIFLRITHKTIRACTKYMLLSYTHCERLFRGNISGKSLSVIHVKKAHLPYHWLILQYVPYLLGGQVVLLRKLL